MEIYKQANVRVMVDTRAGGGGLVMIVNLSDCL